MNWQYTEETGMTNDYIKVFNLTNNQRKANYNGKLPSLFFKIFLLSFITSDFKMYSNLSIYYFLYICVSYLEMLSSPKKYSPYVLLKALQFSSHVDV